MSVKTPACKRAAWVTWSASLYCHGEVLCAQPYQELPQICHVSFKGLSYPTGMNSTAEVPAPQRSLGLLSFMWTLSAFPKRHIGNSRDDPHRVHCNMQGRKQEGRCMTSERDAFHTRDERGPNEGGFQPRLRGWRGCMEEGRTGQDSW